MNTKRLKAMQKHPIWLVAILCMLLSAIYWGLIVTDRYVSKAHVVLKTPDIAPPSLDFSSMLSGASATNTADLLYLRDYLLSVDVLKLLDAKLNLKKQFSNPNIDYFSRMGSDLPMEYFHDYYLKRISVELDSYSNVLVVKASAFDPKTAQQIVTLLLKYGEEHMNKMGQRLALVQVKFIENQVNDLNKRLETAQANVLAYQDKAGLMSPTKSAENVGSVIAGLNTELAKLQAEKTVLSQFQSIKSPQVIKLKSQIAALKQQIRKENNKLTATQGSPLNKITADYQALLLKAQFAQEMYSNALATLEGTRVEAARKLKQVSILQAPTSPEYPIEPDRMYNITVSIILITLIAIILSLFMTIIRDHKD